MCKGSHNAKVLQLDQQHEVPNFFFIDVQNVNYISDTYFCTNSMKTEK